MTGCGGSPSRDLSDYDWSNHFLKDSFPNCARFLTEDMVKKTVEEGRDCDRVEAGRGKLRRRYTFDGVDTVIVLPESSPFKIITGWTEIASLDEAVNSSRWGMEAIQKIQLLDDAYDDSVEEINHPYRENTARSEL